MHHIHRLWDELADFDASSCEAAARHLMRTLASQGGFENVTWAGLVRQNEESRPGPAETAGRGDMIDCWQIAAVRSLNDETPPPYRTGQQAGPALWPGCLTGDGWQFQSFSLRRNLPPGWFEQSFYQQHYASHSIEDAVIVIFPINENCQSHFSFWSDRVVDDETIASTTYALRGIKWFHRRLLLGSGLLQASSPLTPAEQRVLHLLLTDASEKRIAHQLGLAESTTHQHVVAIYRKFGVRRRTELMSIWLNRPRQTQGADGKAEDGP